MENTTKPKLILLDSNAVIHRAYHALPPLASSRGEMTNAVYGFFVMLLNAIKHFDPDYIAAAFDLGGKTFRHREFEDYKAHRGRADKELYQQIPIIQDILKSFKIPAITMRGIEADDIIGSISKNSGARNVIVTGDMDMLQLVDEDTFVYTMRKGMSDLVLYDKEAVEKRYGFGPEYVVDFKGLKGDPSDNIPGVEGIGDKTAAELIKKFGSVENIYKNIEAGEFIRSGGFKEKLRERLIKGKQIALDSKRLATIKRNADLKFNLEDAKFGGFDTREIRKKFENLEMKSLVKKMGEMEGKLREEQETRSKMPASAPIKLQTGGRDAKTLFEEAGNLLNSQQEDITNRIEGYYRDGLFSKEIRDLELAIIPIICEMEENGIKIDIGRLEEASAKISKRIKALAQKIYDFSGAEFNINSSQQLSEILFNKLKISTEGIKKTPGGVISTAASELEKLQSQSPIIPLILKYRELEKIRNTYADALPELVGPDGRIHTSFDQLGTVTGRISSSDPNLQNIPIRSEEGEEIRKSFVAERGYKLVSFDYSQIDLRVMAHISEDSKLIEAFLAGEDIHTATAREIFAVKPDEVSPNMRRVAKTINFGIIYGMSAHGLSARIGISQKEAKKFIDDYFKKFSGVAKYLEKSREDAKKAGFAQTIFGRKRYIPELNSKNWQIRSSGERMAINMPIQGTSADIVKMAMVKIKNLKLKVKSCRLLLQVHDELLFEIREELINGGDIIQEIKDIMESVDKLKVPLVVDVKMGDNWGEIDKI